MHIAPLAIHAPLRTRKAALIRRRLSIVGLAASALACVAMPAQAHATAPTQLAAQASIQSSILSSIMQAGRQPTLRATAHPSRNVLLLLSRPLTVNLDDQRVEDIFGYIAETTGVPLEIHYLSDTLDSGIDPDWRVTMNITGVPALLLIERLIDKANRELDPISRYEWQFAGEGRFEIGPLEQLNRRPKVELYDVRDMLFVIPNFDEAPEFDLSSVLQSGQGGGGQSPFSGNSDTDVDVAPESERAQTIMDLITTLIEPEEWSVNGGDAASIRYFQGSLVVSGPDYIHRKLAGYPFWPSSLTRVGGREGIRLLPATSTRTAP
ncbi:MAG: hypothetical protein AAF995_09385 [Planctomycetota bacterium]